MTIRKIEAGRVITQTIDTFVGQAGTIFYDEGTGEFRLSDGVNPGGIPLGSGGGGGYTLLPATGTRLGGVKVGALLTITNTGTLSVDLSTVDFGGRVVISNTPPTGSNTGTLWYNTSSTQLYIYYNNQWVVASPTSQGYTGAQGTTGAQGVQGTSGIQGTIGIQGLAGTQGIQGVQGTDGTQGVQGSTGTQGIQGVQGSTGTQGIQGVQGSTGTQGIQGVQGTDGTQGVQGSTGTQGIQGVQGSTGTQGIQGVTGPKGDDGTSVNIKGSVTTSTNLPSVGQTLGDGYIESNSGHLWIYTASTGTGGINGFIDVGNISGPPGPPGPPGTSTFATISSGTGVYIAQSGTNFNISIGQNVSTTTSVTFSSVNFISTITTSTMLITNAGITFPNGSFQDRKAPRMYTNADAALGISLTDLFPGDYYYDGTTESIYIMVPITDPITGDFLYNTLLDLTVRAA